MHELIITAVEDALKDWGIDWILEERGSVFEDLMREIELAVGKVTDE